MVMGCYLTHHTKSGMIQTTTRVVWYQTPQSQSDRISYTPQRQSTLHTAAKVVWYLTHTSIVVWYLTSHIQWYILHNTVSVVWYLTPEPEWYDILQHSKSGMIYYTQERHIGLCYTPQPEWYDNLHTTASGMLSYTSQKYKIFFTPKPE